MRSHRNTPRLALLGPGSHRLARRAVRLACLAALVLLAGCGSSSRPTVGSSRTDASNSKPGDGYVALGDSYSSGYGTQRYYASSNDCYRSPDAYPVLIAKTTHTSLDFAACAGATTATVRSSQLAGLSATTALVTIGVGGNDADLLDVLRSCATTTLGSCDEDVVAARKAVGQQLPTRLTSLYAQVRALAPHAHVVVLGYPNLLSPHGAGCISAQLNSARAQLINSMLTLIDNTFRTLARAHGFAYADPRAAFAGHELCSTHPFLNGDLSTSIGGAYHPNRAGQRAFAQTISAAL